MHSRGSPGAGPEGTEIPGRGAGGVGGGGRRGQWGRSSAAHGQALQESLL